MRGTLKLPASTTVNLSDQDNMKAFAACAYNACKYKVFSNIYVQT